MSEKHTIATHHVAPPTGVVLVCEWDLRALHDTGCSPPMVAHLEKAVAEIERAAAALIAQGIPAVALMMPPGAHLDVHSAAAPPGPAAVVELCARQAYAVEILARGEVPVAWNALPPAKRDAFRTAVDVLLHGGDSGLLSPAGRVAALGMAEALGHTVPR